MLSDRSRALGLPERRPTARHTTAAPGSRAWGTPVCQETRRRAWPRAPLSAFGGECACFLGVKIQRGIIWLC